MWWWSVKSDRGRRARPVATRVWVGALPKVQATFALGDPRGAIFLEKLIVYTPLLLLFFLGFQLAEVSAAQLVVRRASSAAARAAAVVLPDDPVFYDGIAVNAFEGPRKDDIYLSAAMILSAAPQLGHDFDVSVSETQSSDFGPVDVTVEATYHCGGVSLLCGLDGFLSLEATTRQAYHRAQYDYELLPGFGPQGVPSSDNEPVVPAHKALAMNSAGGAPTSVARLVEAVNQACGCTEQVRRTDALCIAKAVAQRFDAALTATFTIENNDMPDLTRTTFAKIERLIEDNIKSAVDKAELLEDVRHLTEHDYIETLQTIQRTIDASSLTVKRRSEGRVATQTVYRLDTRAPTRQGWSGTSYMVPNPAARPFVANDAEPSSHFKSGSEGSYIYVSASGTGFDGYPDGEDLRRQNAELGGTPYFHSSPFLCIKRDASTHIFVTAPCHALRVYKISTNYQYKAVDHATYAPRYHPIPEENEVLLLFLKPTTYRQIVYVEYFSDFVVFSETREKNLKYLPRMAIAM